MGADDAELEERIIQHLAAAAAMGRTHRIARRDGARGRSSGTHGRPHFLVFSTPPSGGSAGSIQSYSSSPGGENESIPATSASPSSLFAAMGDESPVNENTPHGTVGHADDVTASRVVNSPGSVYSPDVQNNRYLHYLMSLSLCCVLTSKFVFYFEFCLEYGCRIGCSGGGLIVLVTQVTVLE